MHLELWILSFVTALFICVLGLAWWEAIKLWRIVRMIDRKRKEIAELEDMWRRS